MGLDMEAGTMQLKILLPFKIVIEKAGVLRIVAETRGGSVGLLPRRRDCVAALVPGILIFESAGEGEAFFAVDEGILVKKDLQVLVSVHNSIGGDDLGLLREAVDREFRHLDEQERSVRQVLAKMESAFIRRLMRSQHG